MWTKIAIALALFLIGMVVVFSSCTSTKHITTQTLNKDSLRVEEQSDSIRVLKSEINRLTSEVNELQFGVVRFDTVFVAGDTVKNIVTIHDGNIEAKGRIISAVVSKNVYTKIIAENQRLIDSLRAVKNKIETKVVTKTEYVDRKVKRSFLTWWIFFLIGAASMYVVLNWKKIAKLFI